MSAKAKIIDNNMRVSNIYIETEMMEAKGNGSINLITKEVEFNFIGKIKAYENGILAKEFAEKEISLNLHRYIEDKSYFNILFNFDRFIKGLGGKLLVLSILL